MPTGAIAAPFAPFAARIRIRRRNAAMAGSQAPPMPPAPGCCRRCSGGKLGARLDRYVHLSDVREGSRRYARRTTSRSSPSALAVCHHRTPRRTHTGWSSSASQPPTLPLVPPCPAVDRPGRFRRCLRFPAGPPEIFALYSSVTVELTLKIPKLAPPLVPPESPCTTASTCSAASPSIRIVKAAAPSSALPRTAGNAWTGDGWDPCQRHQGPRSLQGLVCCIHHWICRLTPITPSPAPWLPTDATPATHYGCPLRVRRARHKNSRDHVPHYLQ